MNTRTYRQTALAGAGLLAVAAVIVLVVSRANRPGRGTPPERAAQQPAAAPATLPDASPMRRPPGPTPASRPASRPSRREAARLLPVTPRSAADAVLTVRVWLDARRAPRAPDETPEAAEARARAELRAREAWERVRHGLVASVRDDAAAARTLLDLLAADPDPEAASKAGAVLAFVRAPGFEDHLVAAASGGPVPRRCLALAGLRGRGRRAAETVAGVARDASEVDLRRVATEELAGHLPDPAAAPSSAAMLAAAAGNLAHDDAGVRSAALRALLASPRSDPSAVLALRRLAAGTDPEARLLAARLLQRWGSG